MKQYTIRFFLLKRLSGLAQILNGLVYFFTGKTTGLPLKVAREIASVRYQRIHNPRLRAQEEHGHTHG